MIGAFDSGVGGLNLLSYARELLPDADLLFLRDTKNCPYGNKSTERLKEITEENIGRLKELGADTVLIACCTASAIFPLISEEKKAGVIPIVDSVAESAMKLSECKRVAVIATEATVRHRAFSKRMPGYDVRELPTQPLVEMVESGITDRSCTQKQLEAIRGILPLREIEGCDCLVLGCTHFSSLKESIASIVAPLGIRRICDSAKVGASALLKKKEKAMGGASTYYITT